MFRKLLKYDLQSVWRVWWILAVSVLGLSVAGAFVLRFLLKYEDRMGDSPLFAVTGRLFLFAVFITIMVSLFATWILVYLRFYRNFFTDEGYLTFTLPVRRGTLLNAKTANSVIWTFAQTALLVVCMLIFFLIAPPAERGEGFFNLYIFEGFAEVWTEAWGEIGAWLLVYIGEYLLLFFCGAVYSASFAHFCIVVGSLLAKKYKLLASIGVYYAVSVLQNTVTQILFTIFAFSGAGGFFERISKVPAELEAATFALLFGMVVVMMAAVACVMYSVTRGTLERKLNLP